MNAVAENGYLVFETDSFSYYLVTVEAVEGEEPGDEPTQETTESLDIFGATGTLASDSLSISWEGTNIKFVTEKSSSTTAIRTSDADHFRVYQGTKTTISCLDGSVITKVVITVNGGSKYIPAAESVENGTATIEGTIVTIVANSNAKEIIINGLAQWRLSKIEVTYGGQSGTTPEQPTHEHTACPECGKCTAADCNGTDADKCQGHEVEPEHEHTACPECGKCTAADCDGADAEKCQGHEQTVIEKITIAELLSKEVSATYYELTGTITNVANTTYGNFTLVDETGSIYVYGLTATKVDSNDKSFASLELNEGDIVTLIGTRADYNGNPQVGGPAYYVSHVVPEYNVSIEVEGEGEATLSAEKAANGSEVTLTVTPTEGYKLSSIVVNGVSQSLTSGQEYKVKVVGETTVKVKFVEDSNEPSTGEEVTATLTFDNASKRTEFDTSHQVWVENGITLTNNKGKSTSNVADYANPARFYKSSEIIIEVAGGIKEISFTCNTTAYATALASSVTGATASGKVVTITLDGTESSYTIASLTGGQVRVDSVTVTYLSESSSN